jgi:regulator of cell morphogenesis and NO signaling
MEINMSVQAKQSVGELVVEHPHRSRIFEHLGIDYCCGGKQSLEDACQRKGLDLLSVIEVLDQAGSQHDAGRSGRNPSEMSLSELADHIEAVHHDYLRSELPRVDQLVNKVANAHGERDPRLVRLIPIFIGFREELMMHMRKEEQILFPMIRQIESGSASGAAHCGSVANPIRQMEAEHDDAGDALEQMRALTDGFEVPEIACNTHRAMLDALAYLERDMHTHVHKENSILFPRAIQLESDHAEGTM